MTIKNTISPRTQAQAPAAAMVQDPELQEAMMTLQQLQVGLSQRGIKTVEDFLERYAKGSELASLLSLQSAHGKIAARTGSGGLAVGKWINAAIAKITADGLSSVSGGFQDVNAVLQHLDTGLLQVGEATLPQSQEMSQHFDALSTIVTGYLADTSNAGVATPADANSELGSRWNDYVSEHSGALNAVDVNALVQQVLRQSYMETTKDLYFYAEKVKFYNKVKQGIRDELSRARDFLAGVAGLEDTALLEHLFYGKKFNTDFLGANGPLTMEGISEALSMLLPSGDELVLSPEMLDKPGLWEAVQAIESRTWGVEPKDYAAQCSSDDVGTLVTSMYYFMAVNNLIQGHPDDYQPQKLVDDLKTNYGIEATLDGEGSGVNVVMPDGTTFHDCSGNGGMGERDMNFDKALTDLSATMGFDVAGYDMQAGFDKMSNEGFVQAMQGLMSDTGSEYPDDKALAMTMLAYMYDDAGMGTGEAGDGKPIGSKADLEAYIENTEELLNTVGDDAQLANVDLQNMLQKQQQTMQMMSNISKMLHDTTMAIIRKIGG